MIKSCAFLFATLVSTTLGAPAILWQSSSGMTEMKNNQNRVLHSSVDIHASDLMKKVLISESLLSSTKAPQLSAVIFLVGKSGDGSEQLSELASTGKLPETFAKYDDATGVYHHVSGIESTGSIVKEVVRTIEIENGGKKKNNSKKRVLEVSLSEFNTRLSLLDSSPVEIEVEIDSNGTPTAAATTTSSNKNVNKRSRALANADIYIVNVSPKDDSATLDNSVVQAIINKNVCSVILGGIRSIEEVKHERFLINKRRMLSMEETGDKMFDSRRRRLEQDEDGNDDAAAQADANDDMSGVYYVSMTPNIFSGILFFFLFVTVVYTGIACMGDIQGGDTYTDKYPSLGREA